MPQPLTPDALVYELTTPGDPQLSPDGCRMLYTLGGADATSRKSWSQVWLCDRDGGNARRLTWSGEKNRGARWSPDGTQFAFVSDRVKRSGIFLMPLDGGEPRELTRHGEQIGELAWSPDGRRIAYALSIDPENPGGAEPPPDAAARVRVTRRLDYKRDTRGFLGEARRHVFVVEVSTGERRQVTTTPFDHNEPRWSPDGRWLAMQMVTGLVLGSQLELIALERGERRLLGAEEGSIGTWAWSPRGERVLFSGESTRTGQPDFYLYNLADGATHRLTDDLPVVPNAGFAGMIAAAHPLWLDDRTALFSATRAGASGLYTIDLETGEVDRLHEAKAARTGLSADAANRYVVQAHSGPDALGEIVLFDRQSGTERMITRLSTPLYERMPPPSWERIDVERGGLTIEAWLLKPPDFDSSKRYPLVLDVHGGPHGFYGYGFTSTQLLLATNGFLVLFANPRGSTSYGRDFAARVIHDWGGEDYLDLLAVLDAAEQRPYVDRARVGIYGYSYGGYMTAWMLGQTDRFAAAVCGAPCFNLVSMYGTSDIGFGWGRHQWGGAPHENPDWYASRSPSTLAHRIRTPTLIVHAEGDDRCPIGQGEEMFVALATTGCEVELVRYPGGSHLFQRIGPPEHRADYLNRVLGWYQQHLTAPRAAGTVWAGSQ